MFLFLMLRYGCFLDGCFLDGCFYDKTPLGETGCLSNLYVLFTGCSGIQFFNSPLSQHSSLGYPWLLTPHCAALVCDLQDAVPCHWSSSASHPTHT